MTDFTKELDSSDYMVDYGYTSVCICGRGNFTKFVVFMVGLNLYVCNFKLWFRYRFSLRRCCTRLYVSK
jgi:hypothetical protein